MTEPIPHWPGRLVSLGDYEVFVRSAPGPQTPEDAEPALCVHGLEGSSRNWTDLIDLLRIRLACDAMETAESADGVAHPMFGYYAAITGMGMSINDMPIPVIAA